VDQVKARFDTHKRKKEEDAVNGHVDFSKRVAMAEEDEEEVKRQGLTLVHFPAQLEHFFWDRGCA
jgi:hypothetical protein